MMIAKSVRRHNLKTYDEIQDNLQFWLAKTPEERVVAVEFLRRQTYGDPTGLQRVVRVVKRPQR
ncbi:MAG: hypothetical protein NTW14_13535 [bacterium]|nr:hypothetical protein [bacterium]